MSMFAHRKKSRKYRMLSFFRLHMKYSVVLAIPFIAFTFHYACTGCPALLKWPNKVKYPCEPSGSLLLADHPYARIDDLCVCDLG